MKTYFKHPYEKSLARIFYSSLDTVNHITSRFDFRQRIVQPSTKEQQRLLSPSSSPRLQHVHSGKYGIKPIWPSDKSVCEPWQQGKKSSKNRWSSVASKGDRDQCLHPKSDLQKKFTLPSLSTVPYVDQLDGSILMLASISLFLLLLIYIVYQRRSTELNQKKLKDKRRRQSLEDNLRIHEPFNYHLPTIRLLPTITEENSAALSPSNITNKLNPFANTTEITPTPVVTITDDNVNRNLSTIPLDQKKISTNKSDNKENLVKISLNQPKSSINKINNKENVVQISLLPKEQQQQQQQQQQIKPPNQRRRSRFEQDSTVEKSPIENLSTPPVVVRKSSITHEHVIGDDFTSLEEINKAVKQVGLDHSQLIFGIDYTISNLETGKDSFHGFSLHNIQEGLLNPYQNVITIVGRTLEKYDSDTLIPVFGFGDRTTLDRKIFPLRPDGSYCKGFRGVLEAYNEITPKVRMSGPTNFAPLIREAIKIVKKTGEYHILVIVADGQVTNERQTKDAIVEASNYPLSIVMVGVGDGPWDMMKEFDDSLPTRQFDNFQFVNYNSVVEASTNTDSVFALRALMEIPSQYAEIKKLGLLKKT
ncbi:unnamed protein product [Rotaria sordida]|uniref:VWFA domain-containing protein n=1 Tax=Rotaria sordida TaxID=392033 RepID=A0A813NPU5_9BILA|nr:unnamed protein product [Rotaria sordida]CAF0869612.1 unnamed protein product [Rotaria sordida]